jgi:hypothetical protein
MPVPLFTGQVIAVIWDFDQTLIPGYQQEPLFRAFGIDPNAFWREVNGLEEHYTARGLVVSKDTLYLNHILTYVKTGKLKGLTNSRLRELGAELQFYPGMPDFLRISKQKIEGKAEFRAHGIGVEHYVLSTGHRQMILGSAIAPHVKGVWASEFIEDPAQPGFLDEKKGHASPEDLEKHEVSQIGYFLDNTTKTRAIWEINKGSNVDPYIDVNAVMAPEVRRVPIRNMLYVADGPTDIPVFSILNANRGRTLGVYNPAQEKHYNTVKDLADDGRVQAIAEADYREGSEAYRWIMRSLEQMATQIGIDRDRALRDTVHPSGGHIT